MNERTFLAKDAHKLEDPERHTWLPPADVLARLGLRKGMTVADIGAGTGYFTLPISREIGNTGRVFAVDLQQEMLELLRKKLPRELTNVELHKGEALATTLKDHSIDLAFIANVWHELDDYSTVLKEIHRILKPAGKLAILDWRPDVSVPPGPPFEHRIAPDKVAQQLRDEGWKVTSSDQVGTYGYLVQGALQ